MTLKMKGWGLFSPFKWSCLFLHSYKKRPSEKVITKTTETKGNFMVADSIKIEFDHVKLDRVKIIMN